MYEHYKITNFHVIFIFSVSYLISHTESMYTAIYTLK